ncbi:MAG TPA: Maf family protein [Verrucomicrobiota bacterium]|nr:Maf family protein [Verrucomicrobiota bacterium]
MRTRAQLLPALILASASPRRAELLREAGVPFRVEASGAPEPAAEFFTPREFCLANATRKACAVAARFPAHVVLGADTEVALGRRVFGKPRDADEAAAFLADLAGRTHEVITGVALVQRRPAVRRAFTVVTRVKFRPLAATDIAAYLARIEPRDKAGGYAIQEHGERIVEAVEGPLSNVIGLPVERVLAELEQWPGR